MIYPTAGDVKLRQGAGSGRADSGTSLEDRPRYTRNTTFGTFPFPSGLPAAGPVPHVTHPPDGAQLVEARVADHRRYPKSSRRPAGMLARAQNGGGHAATG